MLAHQHQQQPQHSGGGGLKVSSSFSFSPSPPPVAAASSTFGGGAATSVAQMAILPGVGLGPFRLGSSIGSILAWVTAHAHALPHCELVCAPTQPTAPDITLDLRDMGTRLRFDAREQRLSLIDVYDHARAPLVYMKTALASSAATGPPRTASFDHLYRLFGPTFAGTYDVSAGMYLLQYPGVCMAFPLPSAPTVDGEPLRLPDGSSPQVARIFLHAGPHVHAHSTALPPLSSSDVYFEPMTVHLSRGLFFERRGVFVGFESFAQDLLADLGPPQNIYSKQPDADKMNIHKHSAVSGSLSQQHSPSISSRHLASPSINSSRPLTSDYFFNYFLLGFDALLDGVTHRVKKLVLHTNFVDRPDFNQYAKCNFAIAAPGSSAASSAPTTARGGVLSLLELPPTALAPNTASRSMLHGFQSTPATSDSSSGASSISPSPPQSISIHTGVEDVDGAFSAASGKKKKKAAAAAAAAAAASNSPALPPRSALPPPSPAPLVSFSPSLSPSVLPASHATVITPDSKWSDVLAVLGPCPSRPMVSASSSGRSVGSSAVGSGAPENPFSSTYFYAYAGAVFEVCKNHHLASVTLFRDE